MKQIEAGAWKIVAGALIFSFGLSLLKSIGHHTPAAAAAQPAAATTAAASPRAASTTSAPLVVVFPALTPPAGLTSGRAEYTIAGAAWLDFGKYGEFSTIGSVGVPSSTTSFSSLPIPHLSAYLQARGLARESWLLWTRVTVPGEQTFVIQLRAPAHAVAALHVDGLSAPVVSLDNLGSAGHQTGLGRINLGKGWHTLTLSVTHSASEPPASTRVDVFMRGPDEASPTNFTPFSPSADTLVTPAASAVVPTPAASAPRAIPVGGEGQPAPSTTEKKS